MVLPSSKSWTRASLFLGALGFASPACVTWDPTAAPRRSELDSSSVSVGLSWDGNLPLVSVYLGSRGPYTFLLDTGAEATIVSPSCARDAKLETTRRWGGIGGAAGSTRRELEIATLPELSLGGARFSGFAAIVDEMAPGLDGILGFCVFADLLLTLDGPDRKLILERGQLPSPDSCSSCLPLESGGRDDGRPRVRGQIAGRPAVFLIDSGFDGVLFLATSIPENQNLNFEPDPKQDVSVRTRLGTRGVRVGHLMERVEIGSLSLDDPPAMLGMGGPVILGGGFLRTRFTTFDPKNRRMGLQ